MKTLFLILALGIAASAQSWKYVGYDDEGKAFEVYTKPSVVPGVKGKGVVVTWVRRLPEKFKFEIMIQCVTRRLIVVGGDHVGYASGGIDLAMVRAVCKMVGLPTTPFHKPIRPKPTVKAPPLTIRV